MKLKVLIVATALTLTVITSIYNSIGNAQAIEDNDYINSPEYVAECYDADTNIGTLEERLQIYEYLTSHEYTESIFEKTINPDGSVSYNPIDGAKQYIKTNETLENGDIIQYIYYTDKDGNYVRLHDDGIVDLLVGDEYNQYYIDQVKEYSLILNEINQEYGYEYSLDFSSYTPKDAQKIVNDYKSMTLDEFRQYATNRIVES